MESRPIILIDMDNVVADFDTALYGVKNLFINKLQYPAKIGPQNITKENMWTFINPVVYNHELIRKTFSSDGFFANIPVISGAQRAIREMEELGIDFLFCSTPEVYSRTCHSDKSAWLKQNFSEKCAERLILTHDKTVIIGDILIDDKINIHGRVKPTWTHILFDTSYNINHPKYSGQTRLRCWDDWKSVVKQELLLRENLLGKKYMLWE